jgi:dolichol-phosphate mannosyltransferase
MKVSIVIPIFNEEGVILETLPRFHSIFESTGEEFEMICVDDGSRDDTWKQLSDLAIKYPRILALRLSRNFGHDAALFAGFQRASGTLVGTMDSDGEHPPDVMVEMLRKIEATGADVVNAVKVSHGNQSWMYRISVKAFGWMLSQSLDQDLFRATEFKMLRRNVVDVLKQIDDFHFFYRALVPWVGFVQIHHSYEPKVRMQGATHWSFTSLVRFAISGLILFSNLPLRASIYGGAILMVFCAAIFAKLLWSYIFFEVPVGYGTVLTLLLLHLGVMLCGIGMLGLYVFANLRQSIRRPRAIVSTSFVAGREVKEGFVL